MYQRYEFVGRTSDRNRDYHIDSYIITHPDGSMTKLERQVPKRVGKTKKDNRAKS